MNYDEMIEAIEKLNFCQKVCQEAIPHGNNFLYQLKKKEAGKENRYEKMFALYMETRTVVFSGDLAAYVFNVVQKVNNYMDFFWPPENNPFSHRADFTSSIIPEMLCTIFANIIRTRNVNLEVSAQKDLIIECIFDISVNGRICFKNKRVDVAVVKRCDLSFNGNTTELPIPVLAIECKTNLDKNMLSGIEYSVTELKKTFPNCCYFVVTECSDFDVKKLNYASSGINEMYILRKQKRGEKRRNPTLRQPIDAALVYEVAMRLISNIESIDSNAADLAARLKNGKLIGRK